MAGYMGPDYFCDRERETAEFVEAIENDRNVTLMAPRRIGKTALIENTFHKLRTEMDWSTAFIARHDLRAPSSVSMALERLLDREMLCRKDDGYMVYDQLFGMWLKMS